MNSHLSSVPYFDHYARDNDLSPSGRKFVWPYFRKLYRPLLPADHDAHLLDFGCGTGTLLEWLHSEGYKSAEGIDTDRSQIAFAEKLNVNARWVPNSTEWLKGGGPYKAIFLTDVLEHIPDDSDHETLCCLYDALAPGGILIVKVPNANSSFAARARYLDPTHRRVYTEELLRCALDAAGFCDVRTMPDDVWMPRSAKEAVAVCMRFGFRALRRLEAITEFGMPAAKWPLSHNVIGIGCRPSR